MFRILVTWFFLFTTPLSAGCSHAIVLALDISGSVNPEEYLLQKNGLANALESEKVRDAFFTTPGYPVSIAVFEWSASNHQTLVINWVDVTNRETLDVIAKGLRAHKKDRATLRTAIGSAVDFAQKLLAQKPDCWRHTIDVSGDGNNNDGPLPTELYDSELFQDITVNGLVVAIEDGIKPPIKTQELRTELQSYYNDTVLHGENAFSILAKGYSDFEDAMAKKLIKELTPPLIGGLDRQFEAADNG